MMMMMMVLMVLVTNMRYEENWQHVQGTLFQRLRIKESKTQEGLGEKNQEQKL